MEYILYILHQIKSVEFIFDQPRTNFPFHPVATSYV